MSEQGTKWLYPVHIDGKSGFIDAQGSVVVQARFDRAGPFEDGRAMVADLEPDGPPVVAGLIKQKVGFVNSSGEMVTPLKFDHAREFSEGRAAVMVGKKWGFIDRAGEIVIEPQFDAAWSYSEGIAPVQKKRLYLLIDPTGRVLFEKTATAIGQCRSGLIPCLVKNHWSYLDRSGATAFELACHATGEFSEGLASFVARNRSRSMGYIDPTGQVVISPQFVQAGHFHEGLASVEVFNVGPGKCDYSKPSSSASSTARGPWPFPRRSVRPVISRRAWLRCAKPQRENGVILTRRAGSRFHRSVVTSLCHSRADSPWFRRRTVKRSDTSTDAASSFGHCENSCAFRYERCSARVGEVLSSSTAS